MAVFGLTREVNLEREVMSMTGNIFLIMFTSLDYYGRGSVLVEAIFMTVLLAALSMVLKTSLSISKVVASPKSFIMELLAMVLAVLRLTLPVS